jgi:amino acid permease
MFPNHWFKAASAVPNIIFAISFQINLFPVFKGMKNANDSKMKNVTLVSIACCTLSYLLIGILGYYYVGDTVEVNFLNSLPY